MSSPHVLPPSTLRMFGNGDSEVYVPLPSLRLHADIADFTRTLGEEFARSNKGSIEWERNKGDISKLIKYWTRGAGAAKIGWGKPCDFCSCVNKLRKYIPQDHKLKGFCARLHKRVTGKWPGPRSKGKHCPC